MPKIYVRISYPAGNLYESDIDTISAQLSSGFFVPAAYEGQNLTFWQSVAGIVGGVITKFLPADLDNPPRRICSTGTRITPRKLIIHNDLGQSLGIPVQSGADLKTVAQNLVTLFNDNTAPAITCVQLQGERIVNANKLFNISHNGTDVAPAGGNAGYYKGIISYLADTGDNTDHPVKIRSGDPDNNPPPIITPAQWEGCAGTFKAAGLYCPGTTTKGSRPLKHRKYVIWYAVTVGSDPVTETREIPVNPSALATKRAEIKACGDVLAGLTGLTCLQYFGENSNEFDSGIDLNAVTP